MKARLYFAAVLFFHALACDRKPHTDPTDLTDFFLLMALNLTEVSRCS